MFSDDAAAVLGGERPHLCGVQNSAQRKLREIQAHVHGLLPRHQSARNARGLCYLTLNLFGKQMAKRKETCPGTHTGEEARTLLRVKLFPKRIESFLNSNSLKIKSHPLDKC